MYAESKNKTSESHPVNTVNLVKDMVLDRIFGRLFVHSPQCLIEYLSGQI